MRNVRLDCGFADGQEVTAHYDPMIAKLIVWEATREEAIETMCRALRSYTFAGIKTNVKYLERILAVEAFKEGKTFTDFLIAHESELAALEANDSDLAVALGAYLLCVGNLERKQLDGIAQEEQRTVWGGSLLNGFRSA